MKKHEAQEICDLMNLLRAKKIELEKFNKIKRDGIILISEHNREELYFRQNSRDNKIYTLIHKFIKSLLEDEIKEIENKIKNY